MGISPFYGIPQSAPSMFGAVPWIDVRSFNAGFAGAKGDGVADDTDAIERLDLAAQAVGATLLFSVGTYRIIRTITLVSPVVVAAGGVLNIAVGHIVTFNGPFSAGLVQCFSGAGTVHFGTDVDTINAEWWTSNVNPGVTDMSSALNAAIASVLPQRGVTIPIRKYGLGSTVTINERSVELVGAGWGVKLNGEGSSLTSLAAIAGSPMIVVQNSQGATLRRFRFIGSNANKPSCAIQINQTAVAPNDYNRYEDLWIGSASWDPTENNVPQFVNGIDITGNFGGNDSNGFNNIVIMGCSIGILIDNSQYLIQNFLNLFIWNSTVAAIKTKASLSGANWFFAQNVIDIWTYDNAERPNIDVQSFNSESAGRMLLLEATGSVHFHSGYWQARDGFINADLKFIKAENSLAHVVRLDDFELTLYPGYAGGTPLISMKALGGGEAKNVLIVKGASSLGAANLSMTPAAGGTNEAIIAFEQYAVGAPGGDMAIWRNHLGPAEAVDATRYDVIQEGFFENGIDLNTPYGGIVAPTLLNSWINFGTGTHLPAGYYKDPFGIVHLRGSIKDGSAIPTIAFTLPAGYRPVLAAVFAVDSNGAFGSVSVAANGDVTVAVGNVARVSLDGIKFRTD